MRERESDVEKEIEREAQLFECYTASIQP